MGKPVIRSDSDPMKDGEMTYGNPANDIIQSPNYEDQAAKDYTDIRKMANQQGAGPVMDIIDQQQPPITRSVKADNSKDTGVSNGDHRRANTRGYHRVKM